MTGIQRLKAFLRSPHHAWLALLTVGIGVATASVPGMIVAAAAYALGWIFLPDSPWFRRWAEKVVEEKRGAETVESTETFRKRRAEVYGQLSESGRRDYDSVASAIEEILSRSGGGSSLHAGRLGQLAWTYLRLLLTRETLTAFCAQEASPAISAQIDDVRAEIEDLESRALQAEDGGQLTDAGGLERLTQSKRSRLETLEQRLEHVRKAEYDLTLTHSEIERIHDAVRLIQADLVTRRDPDSLGAEIDRTTSEFYRTRDWLRDLDFDQTPADISDEVTASAPLRVAE